MSFPNPDNYARNCDCGTAGANTTPPPASLVAEAEVQNLLSSIADPADAGSGSIYAKYGTISAVSGSTRGVGSVDLQQDRNASTQVASGLISVICGGSGNSAAGEGSTVCGGSANSAASILSTVLGGLSNTASNDYATVAGGAQNIVSGAYSIVSGGFQNQATGGFSATIGGYGAVADRRGMIANSSGTFGSNGDSQAVSFVLRTLTTTNSPTNVFLDGTGGSNRLTIPPGKILACTVNVSGIRSDGSQGAHYIRKVMIKNLSGTTSLVGAVSTVGTDVEDVAGWDVTITADNTNDALDIKVTGATSSTIRWVAVVQGLEIAYGT
jgi:hypothetical protein